MTLQVVHISGSQPGGDGHEPFYVVSDENGSFEATWYVDPFDSSDSYFRVTGDGQTSGVQGSATFWDAGGGSGSFSPRRERIHQDFDTLAKSGTTNSIAINGWYLNEAGTSARNNGQYASSTGSDTAGDVYSFGRCQHRTCLRNLVQRYIEPHDRCAVHEQHRQHHHLTRCLLRRGDVALGSDTRNAADRLDFQLSGDATSLATGMWIDYNSLDFYSLKIGATGALNGNASGNQTSVVSPSRLSIPMATSFWIRWTEFDIAPGADDGLGIDDSRLHRTTSPMLPGLTVGDVMASEGLAGTTSFAVTVNLSTSAGAGGVTFDISTSDGTAQDDTPPTEDNDYVAKSLTGQSIPEGSSTYTFSVLVNGDATTEPDETFFVDVSNVTGADLSDGRGQATILNDDATDVCAAPFTPIHQIQGSGLSAAVTAM